MDFLIIACRIKLSYLKFKYKMQLDRITSTQLLKSIAIGIVMLTLGSCGQKEAPAPSTPAAEVAGSPVKSGTVDFAPLQVVVDKTKAAATEKDLNLAKQEFDKFETSWKPVEDGVKSKSSANYNAIEEGIDGVNKGIKDKNPANVLTSLQSLSQAIASLSK